MEIEEWRPIPGYEGYYEVSDQGRVRSVCRTVVRRNGRRWSSKGRILKQHPKHGYLMVGLSKNGDVSGQYVHRLVLTAFRGAPLDGLEGCHNNDIRSDNRLDNLRWDTHKANVGDAVARGRHRNPNAEANAAKTHCKRGHPLAGTDAVSRANGRRYRSCRECRRITERNRYHHNKSLGITKRSNGTVTHCKRGHKFTADNTYVRPNGKRNCMECRRLKGNAWYQLNKAS